MKSFKILSFLILGMSFLGIVSADEPVCPRCESIREYNKTHHKNYKYYEDYLKDDQGQEQKAEGGLEKAEGGLEKAEG